MKEECRMRLMTSMLDRVLDSLAEKGSSRAKRARNAVTHRAIVEALEPRVLLSMTLYYQQLTNPSSLFFGPSGELYGNTHVYESYAQQITLAAGDGLSVSGIGSALDRIDDLVVVMNATDSMSVNKSDTTVNVTLPAHCLVIASNSGVFNGNDLHVTDGTHVWNKTDSTQMSAEMLAAGFSVASSSQYLTRSYLESIGLCDTSSGAINVKAVALPSGDGEDEAYGWYEFSLSGMTPTITDENLSNRSGFAVSNLDWQDATYRLLSGNGHVDLGYGNTVYVVDTAPEDAGIDTYYKGPFFDIGSTGARTIVAAYTSPSLSTTWNITSVPISNFNCNCNPIYNPGVITTELHGIDPNGIAKAPIGVPDVPDITSMDSVIVPGTGGLTLRQTLASMGPLVLINGNPNDWGETLVTYSPYVHEIFQRYTDTNGQYYYVSTMAGSQTQLVLDTNSYNYVLTDADGKVFVFPYNFNSFGVAPLWESTNAGGVPTYYFDNGTGLAAGFLSDVVEVKGGDGATVTDTSYSYDEKGRVSTVSERTATDFDDQHTRATWTTLQTITYAYYGPAEVGGPEGSVKMITVTDASSPPNILSQTAYRYYTTSSTSGGFAGGVQYVFGSDSYMRLTAAGLTLSSDASLLAPYAEVAYTYNEDGQVASQAVQGSGCSACSGGLGTYAYDYAASNNDGADVNAWTNKLAETYLFSVLPAGRGQWRAERVRRTKLAAQEFHGAESVPAGRE
jgi:hypothetical protein